MELEDSSATIVVVSETRGEGLHLCESFRVGDNPGVGPLVVTSVFLVTYSGETSYERISGPLRSGTTVRKRHSIDFREPATDPCKKLLRA